MAAGPQSLLAFWAGGAGATSAPAPADGGYVSMLAFWAGGAGQSGVTPTPPPPPAVNPTGGWKYDPLTRRTRKVREDEQPAVLQEPQDHGISDLPPLPVVDLAALDAQIQALGERIAAEQRGRAQLIAQLQELEIQRQMAAAIERRRRILAADDEWFMLS